MNMINVCHSGGLRRTILASLAFGVLVASGAGEAQASEWAFKQFEDSRRQSVSFSDGGDTTTYRETARRGGSTRATRQKTRTQRNTRYAARGDTRRDFDDSPSYTRSTGRSLSGGGIIWQANAGCLNGSLRAVVASVAANFGPVRVSSTCRSGSHNRRVGGAPQSHHLTGNAVDFRVLGGGGGSVMAFLRSQPGVGGVKHYGGGLYHIDTGARRSW